MSIWSPATSAAVKSSVKRSLGMWRQVTVTPGLAASIAAIVGAACSTSCTETITNSPW